MLDVAAEIANFNTGRDPERLSMKYELMRTSAFVFLRGTCHLFYARLPSGSVIAGTPATWICGDMHLENFGSYKGDNRLIYFDMNDFDEACLAPCLAELVRLLTSVLVAADSLQVSRAEALALCHTTIDSYSAVLRFGKARWIEEETAEGMVRELFEVLHEGTRVDHLNRRTDLKGKKRVLKIDGKKAYFKFRVAGLAGQVRASARRSEYLTRVEEVSWDRAGCGRMRQPALQDNVNR
ncbi:uncharacterized protein DUF2252 [Paraburkholderia sp. BL10I2N1]|nr:uncharacterized protein DUF2252 [Paraburkholderia sp. BL10I2N1]